MGAEVIIDLVYGRINPSGKLAVSIPWCVGQVPISYWDVKTGHVLTADNLENRFTSRYMDIPNTPLYPFGFGLSYTEFDVSDVEVRMEQDKRVHVHCKVSNTGNIAGGRGRSVLLRNITCICGASDERACPFSESLSGSGRKEGCRFLY